jgi:hypothetical protein
MRRERKRRWDLARHLIKWLRGTSGSGDKNIRGHFPSITFRTCQFFFSRGRSLHSFMKRSKKTMGRNHRLLETCQILGWHNPASHLLGPIHLRAKWLAINAHLQVPYRSPHYDINLPSISIPRPARFGRRKSGMVGVACRFGRLDVILIG